VAGVSSSNDHRPGRATCFCTNLALDKDGDFIDDWPEGGEWVYTRSVILEFSVIQHPKTTKRTNLIYQVDTPPVLRSPFRV
jgi:hypothetical protein